MKGTIAGCGGYERIVPKQTHIHAGKYATAHLYSLCGKHRPAGQLQNIISKREKEEKNHEKNSSSCTFRSNDAYRLRQRIHNRDHSSRKPGSRL